MELQRRLVPQGLKRMASHTGDRGAGGGSGQRAERGYPPFAQPHHLITAYVGHQREVILGLRAGGAHPTERAQRAVLNRVRLGFRRRGDRRLEPRSYAAVVRREVIVAERAPLADAEQHVHVLLCSGGKPWMAAAPSL
jgi:hypothetical protein